MSDSNNEDFDRLKELFLSGNKANVDLALALAASQKIKAFDNFYKEFAEIYDFWKKGNLENYPQDLHLIIPYFEQHGLNFIRNDRVKEITKAHKILAQYIRSVYIWYTRFHSLPTGLGIFENIERIVVNHTPLTHIKKEIWNLPKLKELDINVSKNFSWGAILLSKSLERLIVRGIDYPSLPEALVELEGLKSLSYGDFNNLNKNSVLPDFLWEAKHLEELEIEGQTIPMPEANCFEKFQSLKKMNLAFMNWDKIPESLLAMKNLKELRINSLVKLASLPNWFAELEVQELSLHSVKINNALEIIQKMPKLKKLSISKYIQEKVTMQDWKNELNGVVIEFV